MSKNNIIIALFAILTLFMTQSIKAKPIGSVFLYFPYFHLANTISYSSASIKNQAAISFQLNLTFAKQTKPNWHFDLGLGAVNRNLQLNYQPNNNSSYKISLHSRVFSWRFGLVYVYSSKPRYQPNSHNIEVGAGTLLGSGSLNSTGPPTITGTISEEDLNAIRGYQGGNLFNIPIPLTLGYYIRLSYYYDLPSGKASTADSDYKAISLGFSVVLTEHVFRFLSGNSVSFIVGTKF